MKTISIRDLRQRWPEAEAALKEEDEIIITRDSKPVAKLVRVVQPKTKRKRWDPEEDKKWMKKVWGNKMFPSSDEQLAAVRADRKFN
jgi:antitoxin (DNA-binding transcriptional repressor) of toxin-antitoxin stability system